MKTKAIKLINDLAKKAEHLEPPIHVVSVCTGGRIVGKQIYKYFKQKGIKSSYHEVWTNIVKGKAVVWKSNFKKLIILVRFFLQKMLFGLAGQYSLLKNL